MRDVRDLITYYNVDHVAAERIRKLASAGRSQSWWKPYSDGLSPSLREYLDLETSASIIRTYLQGVIPGTLQTPRYTAHILAAIPPAKSPEVMELLLEIRRQRKQLLIEGEPPKQLIAVIDEGAVMRLVGGPETMLEQLEHILMLADYPNIAVHVLPFDAGEHAALAGMFTIFQFAEDIDRDVVGIETHSGDRYLEESHSVLEYLRMFDGVINKALSSGDTRAHLSRLVSKLKTS